MIYDTLLTTPDDVFTLTGKNGTFTLHDNFEGGKIKFNRSEIDDLIALLEAAK